MELQFKAYFRVADTPGVTMATIRLVVPTRRSEFANTKQPNAYVSFVANVIHASVIFVVVPFKMYATISCHKNLSRTNSLHLAFRVMMCAK